MCCAAPAVGSLSAGRLTMRSGPSASWSAPSRAAWADIFFATEDQLSPEYLAINPNGVVPSLVHDGEVVIDSSCILEYLDEVFPDPAMSPATPVGRAQMRAWLRYFEEVPTTAVRVPSFERVFLKPASAEHQKDKGRDKVEVDQALVVAEETHQRTRISGQKPDGDRQVNVERTQFYRLPGAVDEVAAADDQAEGGKKSA